VLLWLFVVVLPLGIFGVDVDFLQRDDALWWVAGIGGVFAIVTSAWRGELAGVPGWRGNPPKGEE